jgi:HD-GYP domain-containing protein (c-di-GMP phosphodiesterase class II)
VRLNQVVAVLSQATDLAMGQPREYALPSCLLALRIAETLSLDADARRRIYYHSLLRYLGCNAESSLLASVAGDELLLRRDYVRVDTGNLGEVAMAMFRSLRVARAGASAWQLARMAAQGLLAMPRVRDSLGAHCEVAQRLAARLGFGPDLVEALGQLYERWDGKGEPKGLKGEAILLSTRIVSLAQDAVVFHHLGGREAVLAMVRKRRGAAYDPALADLLLDRAPELLTDLDRETAWDAVLAAEPAAAPESGPAAVLTPEALDRALEVAADFADMKSAFTLGHSPAVAALVSAAAPLAGFGEGETRLLRQAALVHNLGRVGVSAGLWDKPGPFSDADWDKVRLHPYYTERLLSRSAALAPLGRLASRQAERMDASGYHRGLGATDLSPAERLMAAAVVYQSLQEPRPHRPPYGADEAAGILQAEVKAGRLDAEAVRAVLSASGQAARARRTGAVGGLSEREVEVLGQLARGLSIKAIAEKLFIAPKTVDRHIQNIYAKIGVSTRAAAALFAVENRLL